MDYAEMDKFPTEEWHRDYLVRVGQRVFGPDWASEMTYAINQWRPKGIEEVVSRESVLAWAGANGPKIPFWVITTFRNIAIDALERAKSESDSLSDFVQEISYAPDHEKNVERRAKA